MSRILAIDFGEKRIGLAVSDPEQIFAFEHAIFSPQEFYAKLPKLLGQQEIGKIIIGYPLNMSGEQTKKTLEVLEFKKEIEAMLSQMPIELPVELIDERLSSKMAENLVGSNKNIDSLAAQIFLQNYLNKNKL